MSISSVGSTTSLYPTTSNAQSPRSLFQQLASDIKSGDLTAAQADFTKLQGFFANIAANGAASSTGSTSASAATGSVNATSSTSDSLSTDIANLSNALQSGDQSSVQAAFQKFAAAAKSALGGGHGHHHHGGPPPSSTNSTGSTDSTDSSSSTTDAFQQWLDSRLLGTTSTSSSTGTSTSSGSGSSTGIDVLA